MSFARIRPRRGTAYEWSIVNPLLEEGELGIEYPDSGIGTGFCKFKIGNGVDNWNDLEYAFDGTTATAIDGGSIEDFHVIQIRSGSSTLWSELNPVPNNRELIYVTDTGGFKVGNGVDGFNDLPYTNSGTLVGDIFDFGDEDEADVIYSAFDNAAAEVGDLEYPDSIFTPVSAEPPEDTTGIDDLLSAEDTEDPGE